MNSDPSFVHETRGFIGKHNKNLSSFHFYDLDLDALFVS